MKKSNRGGFRKGSGRKPDNGVPMSCPISIRLPVDMLDKINQISKGIKLSRSKMIVKILDKGLTLDNV